MTRHVKRALRRALLIASLSFVSGVSLAASVGAETANRSMRPIPAGQLVDDALAPAQNQVGNAAPQPTKPRVVDIAAFLLDERTVSAADFAKFVRAHPEWRRSKVSGLRAEADYLKDWRGDTDPGANSGRPAVYVSWFAAGAYCEARGARLPTTDEWEYAARSGDPDFAKKALAWFGKPTPDVMPAAGSTAANSFGVRDLASLVWEWTADFNAEIPPEGTSCGAGSQGAANALDYANFMRKAFRGSLRGNFTLKNLGFRCAMNAEAKQIGK